MASSQFGRLTGVFLKLLGAVIYPMPELFSRVMTMLLTLENETSSVNPTPNVLLTTLTDQPLSETDLSPTLFFLAATITLLSGVMVIDGAIETEELEHLHMLVDACVSPEDPMHSLVRQLVEGVQTHQVYLDPQQFLSFTTQLDDSARLLLLALGYSMAVVDGHFDLREQMYLQAVAHRLHIPRSYQITFEAIATRQPVQDLEALLDLFRLLHPDRFQKTPVLRVIARTVHSNLPEPNLS